MGGHMADGGMGMQPGIGGLIGLALYVALIAVPFYQLWRRTGHNGWIGVLMAVPLLNLVLLWTLAFKAWPAEAGRGQE